MAFAGQRRVAPDPGGQVVLALSVARKEDGPALLAVEVHLVESLERVDQLVGTQLFLRVVRFVLAVHGRVLVSAGRLQRVSDVPVVIATKVFADLAHLDLRDLKREGWH